MRIQPIQKTHQTLAAGLLALLLPALASAELSATRDLLPEKWFEKVPATDHSIQQSLVFRTVPGVLHTVRSSPDLVNWSDEAVVYGLGHEYVFPMLEHTPAPPPGPGDPEPAATEGSVNVSVLLRPASGTEGGTVVAWPSLDDGSARVFRIAGNMHPDWANVPIFAGQYGGHLFLVGHPGGAVEPPEENPLLGVKDTAMIAALEEHLDEMNQNVVDSTAAARNTPPPAPSSPETKGFFRIKADWSLDTDMDGTPDWMELEMAADTNHPSHTLADPFNGDVDGDGTPDGQQLDFDQDGAVDANDAAAHDGTATSEVIPLPRYALFPITNAEPPGDYSVPYQINDKGTVLYENGIWRGGVWTPLIKDAGALTNGTAYAINDHDVILGAGQMEREIGGNTLYMSNICHWPSPAAAPQAVSAEGGDGTIFPNISQDLAYGWLRYGTVLSNDGKFLQPTFSVGAQNHQFLRWSEWTLPTNDTPASEAAAAVGLKYCGEPDLKWGATDTTPVQGLVQAPDELPELPFAPRNITRMPDASLLATGSQKSMVFKNGGWQDSPTFANAIEVSPDGTAIGRSHGVKTAPILLNGKWTELKRTAPELPEAWLGASTGLLDTTAGGWILAKRSVGENAPDQYAAMLPIRSSGHYESGGKVFTDSAGVDSVSITSTKPGEAVKDAMWIMVPEAGGEATVELKAPISPPVTLELSGQGLSFDGLGNTLDITSPETTFTVKAAGAENGDEIPLTVKLKNGGQTVSSLSTPIFGKVMKRRVIKARVWIVKADDGTLPKFVPTKEQMEEYLNSVFQPQINAVFNCSVETIGPLPFSETDITKFGFPAGSYTPESDELEANLTLDGELKNIRFGGYVSTMNVNIYLVGDVSVIRVLEWDAEKNEMKVNGPYAAYADEGKRCCWIAAGSNQPAIAYLDIIAHEVGHLLFGPGHPSMVIIYPNAPTNVVGVAPLPGSPVSLHVRRLMCDGKVRNRDGTARVIVKREWDRSIEWFNDEIDANRMTE